MDKEAQKRNKLKPYILALPYIFDYQIITKIALGIWLLIFGALFRALLRSSGRVAVTSGDWQFLITTWQGILILLLGIVSLFVYVTLDLNGKIALSSKLVTGQTAPFKEIIKEGIISTKKLLSLRGLIVVLYIALIAPILGIGISITATQGFYIPTFITAVIEDSVLLSSLALVAVLLFFALGIANLFILHGIVIDGMSVSEASKQSRKLIKENGWDYLKKNVLLILTVVCIIVGAVIVCLILPLEIISLLPAGKITRLLTIFIVSIGTLASISFSFFGVPLYLLKMTQLFYSYKQGEEYEYKTVKKESRISSKKWALATLVAVITAVLLMFIYFDQLFPPGTNVKIIAHRAGGNEGAENTLAGMETAHSLGAYGSEIDIQRTKDGHYVLNHDSDFKRVAGDDRKPEEMTLEEVKALSVDGEPVPTYTEALLAAKGRMVLFTELKGATADKQMADDAVALVKQYKMEDECVLVSLKYDLIDYIETNYPEIQTGFLTFASVGETAALNCDYIGLEEESATSDAMDSIHREGKKALVWTSNGKGPQKYFLCSNADGLITDNVKQAIDIASSLDERSDLDRMVDRIKTVF